MYDLAGNLREWTAGYVLGDDGPYVLADPRRFEAEFEDLARISGVPRAEDLMARFRSLARRTAWVRVCGQSYADDLLPAGSVVPAVRVTRLAHHGDASGIVGFRGAVDAVDWILRLGREAEGKPARQAAVLEWLGRWPGNAESLLIQAHRDRREALSPWLRGLAAALEEG